MGGVLLIGASEDGNQVVYHGLKGQTVAQIKQIYEDAAKLCSPPAVVDPCPIPWGETQLVAVNVEPALDIVAAPAPPDGKSAKDGPWRFPIRRAGGTGWIKPESLGMYLNRDVRRAIVLLSAIPSNARRSLTIHQTLPGHAQTPSPMPMKTIEAELVDVSLEKNRVHFQVNDHAQHRLHIPLIDVVDVWESLDDVWDARVAGFIHKGTMNDALGASSGFGNAYPRYTYRPLAR